MKALIVYGTRGGATKEIAEEIGRALTEQGYEATVRAAGDAEDVDVRAFDLAVVGSSVWVGKWEGKATGFLKKNQEALADRKVALFSSGILPGFSDQQDYASLSMEKVAAAFPAIQPLALAYFGGRLDVHSPNPIASLVSRGGRYLEKEGVDTSKPYDTRDFAAIHRWAADVAAKAR